MSENEAQETDDTRGIMELQRLAESNPWWKEIYDEMFRGLSNSDFAERLAPEMIIDFSNVILEVTVIRGKDIEQAQTDEVFKEARQIIENLKPGDTFPSRLAQLYELRKIEALERINHDALRLLSLLTHKKAKEELKGLWNSDRPRLIDSSKEIQERLDIQDMKQRYVPRSVAELARLEERLIDRRDYPFSSRTYNYFTIGENGERDRVNYLAYRVYNPLWQDLMERFEPEYVAFPMRWAGDVLPIVMMRDLYESHKAGRDLVEDLLAHYQQEESLNSLQERIANSPHTSNFSELFAEIVESFKSGHYRISSQQLLSMTEGLLWQFARLWNNLYGNLFDRDATDSQFKKLRFRLLNREGSAITGTPTVGSLLRHTTLGDAISYEFVEHYCLEIFKERNQALHGRDPNYGNANKAAILLFLVSTIEHRMHDCAKDFARNKAAETLRKYRKATGEKSVRLSNLEQRPRSEKESPSTES